MIRPELRDAMWRAREVISAGIAALFGIWLIMLGGYLLVPLGTIVLVVAGLMAVQALRRMRFSQDIDAPGMVEVDEGQVGYLGPTFGGFVAIPDMIELRLITVQGQRLWRLKQNDGQALLIPVAAAGAERLFDAFTSLPGMDSHALVEAASGRVGETLVWQRPAGPAGARISGN